MSRTYRCTIREPHSCPKKTYTSKELTRHRAAYKARQTRKKNPNQKTQKGSRNRKPGKTVEQKVLEPKELRQICRIMADLFKNRRELEKKYPLAKVITNPRVSNPISEAIIYHSIKQGKILRELSKYSLNLHEKKFADITARYRASLKKIEVKSTGAKAFQDLGKKDIAADYLIWLHFGDAFIKNNFSKLEIIIVKKPRKYPKFRWKIKKQSKITLPKFRELLGKACNEKTINLNKL